MQMLIRASKALKENKRKMKIRSMENEAERTDDLADTIDLLIIY